MAIVAILLTTGTPAIKNYSWNLRLRSAMDSLHTDLNFARGRAIGDNTQTVVCPANNPQDCSGTASWQHGWIVFTDINGDRSRQAIEPLLKHTGATELLDITSSRSRSSLRFYPNGSAPGTNTSIVFCDPRGAVHAGKIIVSNSGRIRQVTGDISPTENCP